MNECIHCGDLGVIRAQSTTDDFETLMRCSKDCVEAVRQPWRLPHWSYQWGRLFSRDKCPTEWFKPEHFDAVEFAGKIATSTKAENFEGSIYDKIDRWLARLHIAELYWSSEQAKFNASKG